MDLAIVSSAGGTLLPFTVGQALRQGDVASGKVVLADVPNFQCVVKNRWPDGSAKFVILSGRADLTANAWRTIGLSVGTAPGTQASVSTTDLKATGVTASIQFGSFGTVSWSAGDWDSPVQTGNAGPEMSSFTYRKPIGSDAHLVAWLEVRAYKGGRVEVLPWIENGFIKVASPTAKSGTADFTLGGTKRFSQALSLLNHQRAVLATGTTLTHWFGGSDPQITPRQGAPYLMATKLVPNYRGVTATTSPLYTRLATSYTPLAQANFPTGMGTAGYDGSIGILPEWDAGYLTSGGDPRAYRAVIINAYAAGRYGIHFRDETTNRPLLFASYPKLVLVDNGLTGVSDSGASSAGEYTAAPVGSSADTPPRFANSHHPSMGYMAYLLTGWNYFVEENQFAATLVWLKQNDTTRQGAKGIMETTTGANTTRGAAWAIRSMAQAAAITPDSDAAMRAQFVGSVDENIKYYHGRYVAVPNNPFGLAQPYSDYNPGDPWESASWMEDFLTASFGYLKDLQAYSPSTQTQLDAFLTWKYASVVGRLGSGAAGTFNYRYAAPYTLNYAPSASSNFNTGAGPWYANWGAINTAMGFPAADGGTSLQGTSGSDPANMHEGYWGNMFPALAYAVDHGAAGASAAYARLIGASNFAANAVNFNDAPVWGIKPRTP
jgi:hypothetical protein